MKKVLLLIIPCIALGGTEPIINDTLTGHVKVSTSSVGTVSKPLDFSDVILAGIPFPNPNGGSQLLSGGGVAWTGTGLNYIVSAATYRINGTQYSSPQTAITLSAAHPTNDRIDVFAVTTSSTAVAITGTPGGPPLEPQVNPVTQLRLTSAYIPAASSVPLVTNTSIYLENTEWTSSTNSAGTINLASTNNPYAGTKCIEGSSTIDGNYFTLVKPAAGTENLSLYGNLVIQLRSKAAWAKQKSLSVFWLNGTTLVGTTVAIKDGTFGFNSATTSTYQQIVIPASSFNTGTSLVTTLRVAVSGVGSSIGWYADNIVLQSGGVVQQPGGDFSTNVNVAVSGDFVQFAGTTGKLGTDGGLSRTIDGTFASNSDSLIPSQKATKTYVDAQFSGGGGAPSNAHFVTTQTESGLSAEFSLGSLTSGLLKHTVAASVSTPATAVAGTDYADLTFKTFAVSGQSDVVADTAADTLTLVAGTGITLTTNAGSDSITIAGASAQTHTVTFVVDGSGAVLSTGTKSYIKIPFGGTLTGWTLIGSPSGSITLDILRATDTNGLPVTSIVGGGGTKPALSTAVENKSTSFTGWTSTTLNAFDNLAVSLSGITSTTYVVLTLYYQ